jgi:hypothetical protein
MPGHFVHLRGRCETFEPASRRRRASRTPAADVIEHLFEIDRRRLFLGQAYSSLHAHCMGHLRYSEDEATKRVRVARLAGRVPAVLDEL